MSTPTFDDTRRELRNALARERRAKDAVAALRDQLAGCEAALRLVINDRNKARTRAADADAAETKLRAMADHAAALERALAAALERIDGLDAAPAPALPDTQGDA